MDVHVRGSPAEPFLGAGEIFATEYDVDRPVTVRVTEDPGERTRVSHDDDGHLLTVPRRAATSAMARELALHEFAHVRRYEEGHPSHTQSMDEVLFLALAGHSVERHRLIHCYQIANHMKDVYADDLWVEVAPADKLVAFLESGLAAAVADTPRSGWRPIAPDGGDPEIVAVNAAFALALVERHDLVEAGHRIYDLAHAAADDAPGVDVEGFKRRFRTLAADPDESEYRKALVDATRAYAVASGGDRAAD